MVRDPESIVSAKDVAQRYSISQALVAKVLQQLARERILRSFAGVNGGYSLAQEPINISIERVIHAVEGYTGGLVDCQDGSDHECSALGSCTIKAPLGVLQEKINATFRSMTVAELVPPTTSLIQLEVS